MPDFSEYHDEAWEGMIGAPKCDCLCHEGLAAHVGPCKCYDTAAGAVSPTYPPQDPAVRFTFVDLFAGTGSATKAFRDDGDWFGISVENNLDVAGRLHKDNFRHITLVRDVLELQPDEYPFTDDDGGASEIDFLWASVPCTTFSMAAISSHWHAYSRCLRCGDDIRRIEDKGWTNCSCDPHQRGPDVSPGGLTYIPKSDDAKMAKKLVLHTLYLVETLRPKYWVIENPRNLLRKMPFMEGIDVRTVAYCQYGDTRQKPTDLFGVLPAEWVPRPMCARGAPCHESAPRGSRTGTQGLANAEEKGMVPYELSKSIKDAIEGKSEPFLMASPEWGSAVS